MAGFVHVYSIAVVFMVPVTQIFLGKLQVAEMAWFSRDPIIFSLKSSHLEVL